MKAFNRYAELEEGRGIHFLPSGKTESDIDCFEMELLTTEKHGVSFLDYWRGRVVGRFTGFLKCFFRRRTDIGSYAARWNVPAFSAVSTVEVCTVRQKRTAEGSAVLKRCMAI